MILAKRAKTVFSETGASFGGIAHIYACPGEQEVVRIDTLKGKENAV